MYKAGVVDPLDDDDDDFSLLPGANAAKVNNFPRFLYNKLWILDKHANKSI